MEAEIDGNVKDSSEWSIECIEDVPGTSLDQVRRWLICDSVIMTYKL